jgi:CBS domain-containing protein
MDFTERLEDAAERLKGGDVLEPVTVRELLSWFGAQRRGYRTVAAIREALKTHDLQTDPDFESEYIDNTIAIRLAERVAAMHAVEGPDVMVGHGIVLSQGSLSPTVSPAYDDPTYRIRKLEAANKVLLTVNPDTPLTEAATKMLMADFSQLPVMTNERDVKGVISWTSIATRLAFGKQGTKVSHFMDAAHEIGADSSMFQAIPIIVQQQYVLVRGSDKRITGIVTSSDLSLQFQQLTEPFLLLSEIENHVRRIIGDRFTVEELAKARDPNDADRKIEGVADLSFGEYIRLLENEDRWIKLRSSVDRNTFCSKLDRVRQIRNDVMHFDPDGIPDADLETLREFTRFLERLHSVGVT